MRTFQAQYFVIFIYYCLYKRALVPYPLRSTFDNGTEGEENVSALESNVRCTVWYTPNLLMQTFPLILIRMYLMIHFFVANVTFWKMKKSYILHITYYIYYILYYILCIMIHQVGTQS